MHTITSLLNIHFMCKYYAKLCEAPKSYVAIYLSVCLSVCIASPPLVWLACPCHLWWYIVSLEASLPPSPRWLVWWFVYGLCWPILASC